MKKLVFILFFLTVSCSSDDGPKPGCYQDQDRQIVNEINEATGVIYGSQCDGQTFVIEPDKMEISSLGLFNPCNLPEEFQVDSVGVVFSGYVYESFDTEDICADFFEVTEIRIDN